MSSPVQVHPPADASAHASASGMPASIAALKSQELEALLQSMREAGSCGETLAARRGIKPEALKAKFDEASALCHQHHFEQALPLALDLVMLEPHDWSHHFLLASCLQRQKTPRPAHAALFYALALDLGPNPLSAYRLGESLAAAGHEQGAVHAFDRAVALAEGHPKFSALQARARVAATSLLHRELERRGVAAAH